MILTGSRKEFVITSAAEWAQFCLAMVGFGISASLMIRSGLGLGPWDSFHLGLHHLTGITVGTASIAAGMVIVAVSRLIGARPGIGTLANMLLIGIFIDVMLPFVPEVAGWLAALAYHLGGIALAGLCTGLYFATGLGKGPRDGLVVAVSARSGWPVGRVRTSIEVVVLAAGWGMGGSVGVGTVLFALLIGPAMQWGIGLFGTGRQAPAMATQL
jgi:uncharacterized protein